MDHLIMEKLFSNPLFLFMTNYLLNQASITLLSSPTLGTWPGFDRAVLINYPRAAVWWNFYSRQPRPSGTTINRGNEDWNDGSVYETFFTPTFLTTSLSWLASRCEKCRPVTALRLAHDSLSCPVGWRASHMKRKKRILRVHKFLEFLDFQSLETLER